MSTPITTPQPPAGPAPLDRAEPQLEITSDTMHMLRQLARARWSGWLMPMNRRAGDRRVVPLPSDAILKTRQMPLPFLWQKETTHGGQIINGATEVGAVTFADIRPRSDMDDDPWIFGEGYINLNIDDGMAYAQRLADGMTKWVSVKLDFNPEYEPADDGASQDGQQRYPSPAEHPDAWRLMNVTAESQPAFDGAVIHLTDDLDELLVELGQVTEGDEQDNEATPIPSPRQESLYATAQSTSGAARTPAPAARPDPAAEGAGTCGTGTAEVSYMDKTTNNQVLSTSMNVPPVTAGLTPPDVNSRLASGGSGLADTPGGNAGDHGSGEAALVAVVTGDTNLPIADRDTPWNGPEAEKRLIDWAGGRFKLNPSQMAKVYLYRDSSTSPKMVTAWKFPIADVIKGQVKIVPRAVFAAAAALKGARGGTKIPKADQQAMRGKLNTIYGRMRTQFKDPKLSSPFDAAVVTDAHATAMTRPGVIPGPQPPWRRSTHRKDRRGLPKLTASATSWAARVAAAVPEEPSREWFTDPGLSRPSKIRVSDEGRIFGHVAGWKTEHAGMPGVTPPRNRDRSYSKFHRHPVHCEDGSVVLTGPLASGGHSSVDVSLSLEAVQAHYDDPRYVIADVACGEDEWGIWVSGALRPGVSPFQVLMADRYSFSGDWRMGELLAACAVSVPGFHLDSDIESEAITAAAAAAGVENIPVLAEVTPHLIADATGAPAVLIAAGMVLAPEEEQAMEQFAAAVDGLGIWLSEELQTLRAEFGMTDTTTPARAGMTTQDVVSTFQTMVREQLTQLRQDVGLPVAEHPDVPQDPATPDAPTPDVPAPATDPGQQPPAGSDTPVPSEPDAPEAPSTPQTAYTEPAAQFKSWLHAEFASFRADHAAALSATAGETSPPTANGAVVAADTGGQDRAALRAELADIAHAGRRRSELTALVHGQED